MTRRWLKTGKRLGHMAGNLFGPMGYGFTSFRLTLGNSLALSPPPVINARKRKRETGADA
ncbi:hypothetical protein J5A66_00460 [Prevotella sp. oral taxon 475]|uniref:hypothetical protein n=1 Tax=Prevotella sp. oral taxon 475 TaxID=712471 RepID=UPI001BAD5697|nr:hypothetical protein [Prevotella sp. oral taxon 475]QUB47346.1 hypothetical protein J5A66_00460 [Prevotella sp. oral taxon 475]